MREIGVERAEEGWKLIVLVPDGIPGRQNGDQHGQQHHRERPVTRPTGPCSGTLHGRAGFAALTESSVVGRLIGAYRETVLTGRASGSDHTIRQAQTQAVSRQGHRLVSRWSAPPASDLSVKKLGVTSKG